MIKHFCDCCGVETSRANTPRFSYHDLCESCQVKVNQYFVWVQTEFASLIINASVKKQKDLLGTELFSTKITSEPMRDFHV